MSDAPTRTREQDPLEAAKDYITMDFFGDKRDIDPGFKDFTSPRRELWFSVLAGRKEHSGDFLVAGDLRFMEALAFFQDDAPWTLDKIGNARATLKHIDDDYVKGFRSFANGKDTTTDGLINMSARIAQRNVYADTMRMRIELESKRQGT